MAKQAVKKAGPRKEASPAAGSGANAAPAKKQAAKKGMSGKELTGEIIKRVLAGALIDRKVQLPTGVEVEIGTLLSVRVSRQHELYKAALAAFKDSSLAKSLYRKEAGVLMISIDDLAGSGNALLETFAKGCRSVSTSKWLELSGTAK